MPKTAPWENLCALWGFRLLWRELGRSCGPVTRALDESFVQPLDLDDNTGAANTANIIAAYNPRWMARTVRTTACKAVALAQDMLAQS